MKRCVVVLTMLLIILTGCNSQIFVEDETDNIHNALSEYLSLLVEKNYKSASEYVVYFAEKPYLIQEDIARKIWIQRVENHNNTNSYLSSFNILTIEPSVDNGDFAQALVETTVLENGTKNTRNIYVHLEKSKDKWKIGYYFRENHSMPDPITNIYTGYISQEAMKSFNTK